MNKLGENTGVFANFGRESPKGSKDKIPKILKAALLQAARKISGTEHQYREAFIQT